jgi:hypothetical protein
MDEAEIICSILLAAWDAAPPGSDLQYPARRMRHLLHRICAALVTYTSSALAARVRGESLWAPASAAAVAALEADVGAAVDLLRVWRDHHIAQLMRDWLPGPARISRNTWAGAPLAHAPLDAAVARLSAVRELLGLRRELLRAVPPERHAAVHDAFTPLAAVNCLVVRAELCTACSALRDVRRATPSTSLPRTHHVP